MKAKIRFYEKHVSVLCELGHVIDSHSLDTSWAGSQFEADVASHHEGDRFERLASKCKGFGHEEIREK